MAPDDLEALAVHADALIEAGSFLGEVIATQLALHNDDDPAARARFAMESRRILAAHHAELFGAFAPHALSVVPKSEREPTGQFAACTASWRLGVIDEVALAASSKIALADTVKALASVPAAHHLRSIVCGSSSPPNDRFAPVVYGDLLEALTRHARAFPRIRSLFVGDLGEGIVASVVGDLAPFAAAVPGLEVLRIRGNGVRMDALALPELRQLELVGDGAALATLHRVPPSRVAKLTNLVLDPHGRRDGFHDALAWASALPKLERLALPGWRGSDKLERLLAFPRLAELRALDLTRSGLVDEIEVLIQHADRFAHIAELDLRFNDFATNARLFPVLRERLPNANLAGRSPPLPTE